jgi:flagellar basal body-associated protein FliL
MGVLMIVVFAILGALALVFAGRAVSSARFNRALRAEVEVLYVEEESFVAPLRSGSATDVLRPSPSPKAMRDVG